METNELIQTAGALWLSMCNTPENHNTHRPPAAPLATPFHSVRLPAIPIGDYMDRFHRHSRCSPECLVIAAIYVKHFLAADPQMRLDTYSVHRLFLTAAVLAIKWRDDMFFSNKYYAHIGGIHVAELNSLEQMMWNGLQGALWVEPEEYWNVLHPAAGLAQRHHHLTLSQHHQQNSDMSISPIESPVSEWSE